VEKGGGSGGRRKAESVEGSETGGGGDRC